MVVKCGDTCINLDVIKRFWCFSSIDENYRKSFWLQLDDIQIGLGDYEACFRVMDLIENGIKREKRLVDISGFVTGSVRSSITHCDECEYCVYDGNNMMCEQFFNKSVRPYDFCSHAVRRHGGSINGRMDFC